MTTVRKGQFPGMLSREQFHERFRRSFFEPAFDPEHDAIVRLEAIAWDIYCKGRKSPVTQKAGPEFQDPDYDMSVAWRATHDKVRAAEAKQKDAASKSRVLLVVGASRNDGTCPGEMSKTFRLTQLAREVVEVADVEADVLDLSHLASDYKRRIYPCKACVSTAMPLCHWPCSCYPNQALGQTGDWMAEVYERWVLAHGVLLLTPVYWYQVASPMKLMMDRLVCADGGNPDLSSTSGKDAEKAKALELAGWSYPKHLAGRAYELVVHGDVAGIETVRHALSDWL
ncbi:MAG TPA: flavodoxin family protein, partial [Burkholderiales bacterium]